MQFSEAWLRSWSNPSLSTQALAQALTMGGLEVEDILPVAPSFEGVVLAEVVEVEPHPQADKLRICKVDDGTGQLKQVVCGAANVKPGLFTAFAKVGAQLPGNVNIQAAILRGIASEGMLCSARELGLNAENASGPESGLLELDPGTPGQLLREYLTLDDHLMVLKLTPNRADCLSIAGLAREVAALCNTPLLQTASPAPVVISLDERLPVHVHAPDLCGRFAGRVIRNINARVATPSWMRQRLERAGQRSVSVLVDISNYVMLERGRPSHVFDLDRLQEPLTVRWAQSDESLTLLNDTTISLDPTAGVIASPQGVESLAGIMGGVRTAVTLATQHLYLEAAFWWPDAIAGRARRYRLASEAAHRFERGVDFANVVDDLDYLTSLILSICGGNAGPVDDQILQLPARVPIMLRFDRCNRCLGLSMTQAEISQIFDRLSMTYQKTSEGLLVTPPSYRFDLKIEADLIEEVARLFGFDRIPSEMPLVRQQMRAIPEILQSSHWLRQRMTDLDYSEAINFGFVDAASEKTLMANSNPIAVLNPIAAHLDVMRSNLAIGLMTNLRHNLNHQQTRVRLFEIGKVFARDSQQQAGPLTVQGIRQTLRLGGVAYGAAVPEQWGEISRVVDFFDVKGDLEALTALEHLQFVAIANPETLPLLHPTRAACIVHNNQSIGWLGELHPRWLQQYELSRSPVLFELDLDGVLQRSLPQWHEVSRQPVVLRDIALWMPLGLASEQIPKFIKQLQAQNQHYHIVRSVQLFDDYRDPKLPDEKSLAFRLRLQDDKQTLDDARVDECVNGIITALQAALPVKLRHS